jgi:hypothetical protein
MISAYQSRIINPSFLWLCTSQAQRCPPGQCTEITVSLPTPHRLMFTLKTVVVSSLSLPQHASPPPPDSPRLSRLCRRNKKGAPSFSPPARRGLSAPVTAVWRCTLPLTRFVITQAMRLILGLGRVDDLCLPKPDHQPCVFMALYQPGCSVAPLASAPYR